MAAPLSRLKKEQPDVVKALHDQGWETSITKHCHIKFVSPEGRTVTTGSSPSDRRARLNMVRDLKKAGLIL